MKKTLLLFVFVLYFFKISAQKETITGHGELLRLESTGNYGELMFATRLQFPDKIRSLNDLFYMFSMNDFQFRAQTAMLHLTTDAELGIGLESHSGKLGILHESTVGRPHIDLIEESNNGWARFRFRTEIENDENWEIAATSGDYKTFKVSFESAGPSTKTYLHISEDARNTRLRTDILQMDISSTEDIGNSAYDNWDNVWAYRYNVGSDSRLKENIEEVPSVLSSVRALRPVTYNYIERKDKERIGFIAQEVRPLFPQAVLRYDIDIRDEKQVRTNYEHMGMSYMELIPVLTKAIQEQQSQILEQHAAIQQEEVAYQKRQKVILEQQAQIDELQAMVNTK